MKTGCTDYTEHELRVAFRLSGLRATVRAIRNRQQQHGTPAPVQQALI